jgi:Ca-activated chloride channel family protein
VVLTDGANTEGVDPVTAAAQAAARHVRVYTIGFGTTTPSQPVCTAAQGGGGFGGGGFPGGGGGGGGGGQRRGRFLQIDEPTLQSVATMTGGDYFRAQDADQLAAIFADLPRSITVQHERHELTAWFLLAGGLLAIAAVGLSLAWNRYP